MNILPEPRIGDAEREAAASALGEHFASGRLTHEEFDERHARVWSAKTNSELLPLFADLPAVQVNDRSPRPVARAGGAPGPRGGSSRSSRGRLPLVPMILVLVVLLIALPGAPWPLLLLGWLWLFVVLRRTWFGCSRRGDPR